MIRRLLTRLAAAVLLLTALEAGLRGAARLLRHAPAAGHGGARILCLGESTTAPSPGLLDYSWPAQLQKILDERAGAGRFEVVNAGVIGTNTTVLLSRLPELLDRHRPAAVVAMAGINDFAWYGRFQAPEGRRPLSQAYLDLRVARAALWAWHALAVRWETSRATAEDCADRAELPADEFTPACGRLLEARLARHPDDAELQALVGAYRFKLGELPAAEQAFSAALRSKRPSVRLLVGKLEHGAARLDRAEAIFRDLLRERPRFAGAAVELAQILEERGKASDALTLLARFEASPIAGRVFGIEGDIERRYLARSARAQAAYRRSLRAEPGRPEAVCGLALLLNKDGRLTEAQEVLRAAPHPEALFCAAQAAAILAARPGEPASSESVAERLKAMSRLARAQGALYIAMQYPRRRAADLREIYGGEVGIVFVDNGPVFEAQLERRPFSDLFQDRFGGDFGHCTPAGNRLIALNVAEAVLKK